MLLFYTIMANAANCINKTATMSYLMHIAQIEASVANIPGYKSAMLVDKGAYLNKIQLIQAYKKVHQQNPLTQNQIDEIKKIEDQKTNYLQGSLCKN